MLLSLDRLEQVPAQDLFEIRFAALDEGFLIELAAYADARCRALVRRVDEAMTGHGCRCPRASLWACRANRSAVAPLRSLLDRGSTSTTQIA